MPERKFPPAKFCQNENSRWRNFADANFLCQWKRRWTGCSETLCWDRYACCKSKRSFQIERSNMLVIVKPALVKELLKERIKISHVGIECFRFAVLFGTVTSIAQVRACLQEGGGLQVAEITCLGGVKN